MFDDIVPPLIPKTVQILFLDGDRIRASGTAFFFCNYLITCHHVYWGPKNTEVVIRFCDANPDDLRDGVNVSYPDFIEAIVKSSPEKEFDYAILDLRQIPKERVNNFTVPVREPPSLYDPVAVIGYPFSRLRPVAHHCYVSSFFKSGPAQLMQLEGSINFGNSGGPVVALREQAVIGYVSTKEAGFTDKFWSLRESIGQNIGDLRQLQECAKDKQMVSKLLNQQEQLQQICDEMLRSSNTGIASAVRIQHLLREPVIREREHLWH